MKIPQNIKPKLNLLISYYRNLYSKTDERFMSKNFIYDDEGLEICTIYTLSRIEHNKTNSYDHIYYSLLDNLHTSYIYAPRADEIIHTVNLSLLKLAERNYAKIICNRITKILTTLFPYLDYIIYKEQAEIYQILLDYYKDYTFNTQLIDKYNQLFDLVDEPLKPILVEITVICYSRIYLDADKSLNTMRLINRCNYDSVITDYIKLLLCFREYKLTTEKTLGMKLIQRCENDDNKIYLCKTYNVLASLYTQQNPDIAISLLQKAIDIFDKEHDINENLAIYVKNLATLACVNNQHTKAIECFQILENLKSNLLLISFPFYIYSLEHISDNTDNNDKIIEILYYLNDKSDELEQTTFIHIFHLFLIKYDLDSSLNLENVLLEFIKLGPQLKFFTPIINIIESEIFEICKKANSFYLYKRLMKILQ